MYNYTILHYNCFVLLAALQFMLECGADPNINGDVSKVPSALHFAVSSSQADCVELLLQYGCNVNAIMLTEEVSERTRTSNTVNVHNITCTWL